MKKRTTWLVVILIAFLMVARCGKKSGLEGKVIDDKGQPIKGLKVIAKQLQLIIGTFDPTMARRVGTTAILPASGRLRCVPENDGLFGDLSITKKWH